MMQPLHIMDAPLDGVNLVEASAGTGKTWNIEALVIRCLMEKRLIPSQVLVVTFTEAATQELRERIIRRLNEVITTLREPGKPGTESDPFLSGCLTWWEGQSDRASVLAHLEACRENFDEAAIHTIHGFCRQVLNDFAHLTGGRSEQELITSNTEDIVMDAVYDFHRTILSAEAYSGSLIVELTSASELNPDKLLASMRKFLRHRDAIILIPDVPEALGPSSDDLNLARLSQLLKSFKTRLEETRNLWNADRDTIKAELEQAGVKYVDFSKNFDKWEPDLIAFLEKPFGDSKDAEKFSASFMRDKGLKKGYTDFPAHPVYTQITTLIELANWFKDVVPRVAHMEVRRLYLERCLRDRITTFDDLIWQVADALQSDTGNPPEASLRHQLRVRFKAVLIDEFQDTDPEQFVIFKEAFAPGAKGGEKGGMREVGPTEAESTEYRVLASDEGVTFGGSKFPAASDSDRVLYLIGDPKQAIYQFRGADLRTYFKAREHADRQFTLTTNFRSSADLVDAVNAVFDRPFSFVNDRLSYHNIASSKPESSFFNASDASRHALQFIKTRSDRLTNKDDGVASCSKWTASHIAQALALASEEQCGFRREDGGADPLRPGDIAVLVRGHSQADLLLRDLRALGIPAVVSSDNSVFQSEEARWLELAFDVLINPQRVTGIKTLLCSRLTGLSGPQFEEMISDETVWSDFLGRIRNAHELAVNRGFLPGLRALFDVLQIEERLMEGGDGERGITNIRHLTELLQAESARGHRNLIGLSNWLTVRRQNPDKSADEQKMRLESDDERVRILTMHGSKGLQFPVVYVPFLWTEVSGSNKGQMLYYDEKRDKFVFETNPKKNPQASLLSWMDELEDAVRLAYVALTRAQYRCYVPFANQDKSVRSPLAALLLGSDRHVELENAKALPDGSEDDQIPEMLIEEAVSESGERFVLHDGSDFQYVGGVSSAPTSGPLAARVFPSDRKALLQPDVHVSSYSSLKRKYQDELENAVLMPDEQELTSVADASNGESEGVERFAASEIVGGLSGGGSAGNSVGGGSGESNVGRVGGSRSGEGRASENGPITLADFPGGTQTGTFWHAIFEFMDYTRPDEAEGLVRELAPKYGFDAEASMNILLKMINRSLKVPLLPGQSLSLADLPRTKTLRELEFMLPYDDVKLQEVIMKLVGADAGAIGSGVSGMGLMGVGLADGGFAGSDNAAPDATSHRDDYLTGFIDLVFEHDGRYYILDYKSDYLGDHPEDYSPDALEYHIRISKYNIQYNLYMLVLSLYLDKQIHNFDPAKHLGGAIYLFLRGTGGGSDISDADSETGIKGNNASSLQGSLFDEPMHGVYVVRPDVVMLEQLRKATRRVL